MAVGVMTNQPADYLDKFMGYIIGSIERLQKITRRAGDILSTDDARQTMHTLSYAFKMPAAWPLTRELLLAIAPKMERAGYRDEWIPFLQQGIILSREVNDTATEAELSLQLGIIYQLRGNYEAAYPLLSDSVAAFKKLNTTKNQARALNRLAHTARLQRQFDKADKFIESALKHLENSDPERAYSYLILALVAYDRRDFQESINFCKLSLTLWGPENNRRMMGRVLTILGAALEKSGQYSEAITICQRAITLFEEIQDGYYQAIAQMNLGNVYLALKQPTEALEHYLLAKRRLSVTQDLLHLGHVTHNIGMAYRQLNAWHKAEDAYLASMKHRIAIGNIVWLVNTLDGLGLVYVGLENSEQAIATFHEALDWLAQIEGEPGYDHLFNMITTHLEEVRAKFGDT